MTGFPMPKIVRKTGERLLYDTFGHVPTNRPFVFGIGLSKTGTTSLTDALNLLGYRAFHLPPIARAQPDGTILPSWPWWCYRFDAMTDTTVAMQYRSLAERFPRARFIYTYRETESWLDSCRRHFTADLAAKRIEQGQPWLNDMATAIYGSYLFERESFLAAYIRHDTEVRAFFDGAENFLTYNVTTGDGWDPLCRFLSKPVPQISFPRSNTGHKEAS